MGTWVWLLGTHYPPWGVSFGWKPTGGSSWVLHDDDDYDDDVVNLFSTVEIKNILFLSPSWLAPTELAATEKTGVWSLL
ncbi:hypothetical protein LINPERPRIM_LOCUS23375, partial [Linum perenne]